MIVLGTQITFADELKDAKNQRIEIENQIKDTIQEKETKENTIPEKEEVKEKLKIQIQINKDIFAAVSNEYSFLLDELSIARANVVNANLAYEKSINEAEESILRLYKNSRNIYVSVAASSDNIFDVYKKINYLSQIIDSDKQIINDSLVSAKELKTKEMILLELVKQKNNEVRYMVDKISELQESRSGVERDIRATLEDISELEQEAEDLLEYSDELIDEIKELQKNTNEYVGGKMLWPVPSSSWVVSYFGMRMHPILKVRKMHKGIDIAASYNRNIVAANDGIVVSSCYINGYGYTVIVDHGGGIATLYAHCSKLKAKTGDLVFKGDLLALIGSSGLATGPHIHFEVRVNGVQKNPFNYLEW